MAEHCVHVLFPFQDANLDLLFALEDLLIAALAHEHIGAYDGHEVGAGQGTLFLYGSDADTLVNAIVPILRTSSLTHAGRVVKRYGPPEDGVREETFLVSASD